jgi:hypothetical protein
VRFPNPCQQWSQSGWTIKCKRCHSEGKHCQLVRACFVPVSRRVFLVNVCDDPTYLRRP